jgi:uncharacterized membrane protein YphA (DoxX/SURF4 family)
VDNHSRTTPVHRSGLPAASGEVCELVIPIAIVIGVLTSVAARFAIATVTEFGAPSGSQGDGGN